MITCFDTASSTEHITFDTLAGACMTLPDSPGIPRAGGSRASSENDINKTHYCPRNGLPGMACSRALVSDG